MAALNDPPERWGAYLSGACGQDEDLRDRVHGLLVTHEKGGSFLEPAAAGLQGARSRSHRYARRLRRHLDYKKEETALNV